MNTGTERRRNQFGISETDSHFPFCCSLDMKDMMGLFNCIVGKMVVESDDNNRNYIQGKMENSKEVHQQRHVNN